MQNLVKENIKGILQEITLVMNEEKTYLTELDAAMGDGDLGLTMCTGFQTLTNEIDNINTDDIGLLLMKLGMCMNSVVPSTMGTLISTCFIKSGKSVKGKVTLTLEDFVKMGDAAVNGVIEIGNTKLGEKTMLDALHPAVISLKESYSENKSLVEAAALAYKAASLRVEETKNMKSVHGRAAYYGEKSLGRPDSGATAVMFIFKAINQYAENFR
ncbi:dihydroxyacetone kinase subunit DhaL [Haloimpatiens sp. FM7330]|uniref:dihydroxyacetone kinase subunit DhaL n=1 Tax=Haloimpatiens sp. FM7330 TaxID=3298610 RepID=UPI0036429AE7